jgi:PEP-CTERM motif
MKCSSLAQLFLPFFCILLLSDGVRADMIPWSYDWFSIPNEVPSNNAFSGDVPLSGIFFDDQRNKHAAGSTGVLATQLAPAGAGGISDLNLFTLDNVPYTLELFVRDDTSKSAGRLDFHGTFNGFYTYQDADVRLNFADPVQSMTLGGNRYVVAIGPYVAPGPANQSGLVIPTGSISAHVDVQLANTVPEPSTLTLAGLGVSFLGVAAWRRRTRRNNIGSGLREKKKGSGVGRESFHISRENRRKPRS